MVDTKDVQADIRKRAYNLGKISAKNGKPFEANPYMDRDLRRAWESGYWSYDLEESYE